MGKILQGKNPQGKVENDAVGFLTLWKKESQNPFLFYLVYQEEERVVGSLLYTKIYERMEIERFFVHEDYRNQGIGSALLKELLQDAKKEQVANITLEVKENNQSALHLYQKFGFQEVSKRENYYHGTDGLLMMKVL